MPRISEATLAEHRQRTTAALLDAWAALLDQHSYDQITMAMVAERAGVARNTIYGYFPDREHLLLGHAEREVTRFVAALNSQLEDLPDADARLRLVISEQTRYFAEHAGPHHDVAGALSPEGWRRMMASFLPIRHLIAGIITAGVADGTFRAIDPERAAELVQGSLSVYRMPVAHGHMPPEAASAAVIDFVSHALRPGQ